MHSNLTPDFMPTAPSPMKMPVSQAQRISIGAALITAFVFLLSVITPFTTHHGDLSTLHLTLELFSIIISILVVIVATHGPRPKNRNISNALIVGFTIIAITDLVHALSIKGMPDLLTPSSASKGIFFWLVARSVEVIIVFAIACKIKLAGSKLQWLTLGFIISGLIFWFGTHHLHLFPETYIEGHGLTSFKITFEKVLGITNLGLAIWLFRQGRKELKPEKIWLAMACFILALGSVYFANYVTPNDWLNQIGHLYKIAAYSFIYFAIFVKAVKAPHELLQRREMDLESILKHIPHGTVRISRASTLLYINTQEAAKMHRSATELVGKSVQEVLSADTFALISPYIAEAFTGNPCQLENWFETIGAPRRYGIVNFVPEHNNNQQVVSVLLFITDYTEREQVQQRLLKSLQENNDLKVALDAHAIVAVTNANGIITSVNEKFCAISKYSTEELIGQSHRIVKSGHHQPAFFNDLWQTISSGNIWNGEICNRAKDGSIYWVYTTIVPFLNNDGKPVQYIAIRADITQRKLAEQEIEKIAFFDQLTGLPNRRLMLDRLNHSLAISARNNSYGAALFVDLDNFKEINNSMGHTAGDSLLKEVSRRLQQCIRQSDTAARFGGDEFILILDDLGTDLAAATHKANEIGKKILQALTPLYHHNGIEFLCTASIGVMLYNGGIDNDTEELLKRADIAMYESKSNGRNRITFFNPALQAKIDERTHLIADLRQAITERQFQLYYQPLVDMEQNICGVEALIRWQHPQRGMVPPFSFIDIAEQSGLIIPIGQWVLETACEQLIAWQHDPRFSHWTISVNVSAKQFHEADYPQNVIKTLQKTGAPAEKLRLELTESMLICDNEESLKKMRTLNKIGINFSLDDFGTGYSSLSYLKQLPFNYLKIDKSFTRDIFTDSNDAAVVRTILALANSLEMGVVAEGVETIEQFNFLHDNGCQTYQGYLFGKPMPLTELQNLFDEAQ